MTAETLKLPLIDLSNLNHQSGIGEYAKIEIRQALEEYGCFEALFDGIPLDLGKSVLDGLEQLFDLPLEIKQHNTSETVYHGYVGQVPGFPLYESLGIEDALSPSKIEGFTKLMWPQGNPSFSNSIKTYTEKFSRLDKIVRKMVLESLGLEKYIDQHMNSMNYVLRIQKYDRPRSDETQPGLLPHTDMNTITILHQLNHIHGLEFLSKDGNKWIKAEPTSLSSFIVVIGTSFHAWMNGRVRAPLHRVTMNGDEARYSTGLFSLPKVGVIIKAPEEMVDEEHPLVYKAFDHHKFVDFVTSNASAFFQLSKSSQGLLWSLIISTYLLISAIFVFECLCLFVCLPEIRVPWMSILHVYYRVMAHGA